MQLLQDCRNQAHKYYGDLFLAAEKTLSDSLFEQAESCSNNEEQQRYFEALQQLKTRGSAMHSTFSQQLGDSFTCFTEGRDLDKQHNENIDLNNLTLLDREELEDELAISVIVSKSNSRNSEVLWKLNRRMAVLRGGKNVNDETNPFGPASVCKAIQAAIAELTIDNKAKIVIYKQLGKVFVVSFSKIFTALNDALVEKNILPNLRFNASAQTAPVHNSPAPQTDSQSPAGQSPAEQVARAAQIATSNAHQHELYEAIRNLQSSIGPRTETASGINFGAVATDGSGGSDTFSPIDYALILSAIQQSKAFLNAAAHNQPLSTQKVEERLIKELNSKADKDARHKMSRNDADTVDMVGMIFRYMLDDPNLHDAVKSLLSHLHTPYLKLALMDKDFLDNQEHKARHSIKYHG